MSGKGLGKVRTQEGPVWKGHEKVREGSGKCPRRVQEGFWKGPGRVREWYRKGLDRPPKVDLVHGSRFLWGKCACRNV